MIPAATENFCRPYMALSSKIKSSWKAMTEFKVKQPHHLAASHLAQFAAGQIRPSTSRCPNNWVVDFKMTCFLFSVCFFFPSLSSFMLRPSICIHTYTIIYIIYIYTYIVNLCVQLCTLNFMVESRSHWSCAQLSMFTAPMDCCKSRSVYIFRA